MILSLIIFPQTATRTAGASVSGLQGIQKLHQQDIDATLSGDPQALADLFTEDAVLLEPGSAAVIGKAAILVENKKEQAEHPGAKIMSYKPDIHDTQIAERTSGGTSTAAFGNPRRAKLNPFAARRSAS